MKIKILLILLALFLFTSSIAEARRSSYSYRSPRNYSRGGSLKWQRGYIKKNGTYIQPHFKTYPDQYKWNNRKNLYGF